MICCPPKISGVSNLGDASVRTSRKGGTVGPEIEILGEPSERALGMSHPWEMTLRQLVEKVRRDYGLRIEILSLPVSGVILTQGGRIYPLPNLEENDLLDLDVLENLVDFFRLPREDFHLDPWIED